MTLDGSAMVQWLFWLSAAGVVYAYAGYPLVLLALQKLGIAAGRRAGGSVDAPTITMIIPVHNEVDRIDAKLQNTRALQYPEGAAV